MALQLGSLLNNRFLVRQVITSKGDIIIYRALDQFTGKEVGIKQLSASSAQARRKVLKEAEVISSLRHPNLMHITDSFENPEQGYFQVTDFVNSQKVFTPSQYPGGMPVREAVPIILAACDALYYLHHNQPPLIHGEINLETITLSQDDQVVLILPGWILTDGQDSTMDIPGSGGQATDPRKDIYDLGVVLLILLTGQSIGGKDTKITPSLLDEMLNRNDTPIPDSIAMVITKALNPDQAQRFQMIEEFKSALLNAVIFMPFESISPTPQLKPATDHLESPKLTESEDTEMSPESPPAPSTPIRRRVPWGLVGICLSIISVVLDRLPSQP